MSGQRARLEKDRWVAAILADPRALPSLSERVELAAHLPIHGESIVTTTLEALSLSCLPQKPPSAPGSTRSPDELRSIHSASNSLTTLSVIAQAANEPRAASRAVKFFSEWWYRTLLENWRGITTWMAHILLYLHELVVEDISRKTHFVRMCANFLLTIAIEAKYDAVREELATHSSTIDCVYYLMCSKGHRTRPEWYCDVPNGRDTGCALLELFRMCFELPSGPVAMLAGIHRHKKKRRTAIGRCFERRGEELVWGRMKRGDSEKSIDLFYAGPLRSLECLIGGVTQLLVDTTVWGMFKDLVVKSGDTGEEPWHSLGRCAHMLASCATHSASKPRASLADLFTNGHFLHGISTCFAHMNETPASSNEVFQALEMVAPYLYLSKVYDCANSGNAVCDWMQVTEFKSPRATSLLSETKRLLRCVRRPEEPSSLCSYFEHGLSRDESENNMLCSGCKSVIYCSAQCQEKDWKLHSGECKQLAALHNVVKGDDLRTSLRTKQDQHQTLEGIINLELPPACELNRDDLHQQATLDGVADPELRFAGHQCPSISSFDFMTSNVGKLGYTRIPAASHCSDPKLIAGFKPWMARINEWSRHVEMNRESTILVDGIFKIDPRYSAIVLAMAVNEPSIAPDGNERTGYRILRTIFSVVPS